MKINLLNNIILDINYDPKIEAYRGYWKEENIEIGIWGFETLFDIASGKYNNVELIV